MKRRIVVIPKERVRKKQKTLPLTWKSWIRDRVLGDLPYEIRVLIQSFVGDYFSCHYCGKIGNCELRKISLLDHPGRIFHHPLKGIIWKEFHPRYQPCFDCEKNWLFFDAQRKMNDKHQFYLKQIEEYKEKIQRNPTIYLPRKIRNELKKDKNLFILG